MVDGGGNALRQCPLESACMLESALRLPPWVCYCATS